MANFQGALAYQSPIVSPDTTLKTAYRSPLLEGAINNAMRFMIDMTFGFSYPGGPVATRPAPGAPVNGSVIYDVAERDSSSFTLPAGQAVAYAGGGFDFSAVTERGAFASIPASVAADLSSPAPAGSASVGSSQQYAACIWVKLPAKADWPTQTTGMATYLSASGEGASTGNMFAVGLLGPQKIQLVTKNGTTQRFDSFDVPDAHCGLLAQIVPSRNGSALRLQLRTAAGLLSFSGVPGTNNADSLAAKVGQIGICVPYWSSPPGSGQIGAMKMRLYQAWIENLARSGRDPVALAALDWDLTMSRIAASAAANGGTSQIFV